MADKIKYSDQTPATEQEPVPQTSATVEDLPDPTSDATRSDPDKADEARQLLKKKAEAGLKNAAGKLPDDQI